MIRFRTYGTAGPTVAVLHGGPGAAGHMAPVARVLCESFQVLEPFQRGAGDDPLTVARHVEDLRELLEDRRSGTAPALIGSSWGAMLALAYAAAHPDRTGPLVLIGCGTFDSIAREQMKEIVAARMDEGLRSRFDSLAAAFPNPDERLAEMGRLITPLYEYDPLPPEADAEEHDGRAHHETWDDMLRLQREGIYPRAFSAVRVPVLMLHGAFDPHPGRMILESLRPYMPQIEYREWEECGHYPWRERAVRDLFFETMRTWLLEHAPGA